MKPSKLDVEFRRQLRKSLAWYIRAKEKEDRESRHWEILMSFSRLAEEQRK